MISDARSFGQALRRRMKDLDYVRAVPGIAVGVGGGTCVRQLSQGRGNGATNPTKRWDKQELKVLEIFLFQQFCYPDMCNI